ncbi:hypothetical protein KR009_001671 [Drosophila setifemur]|nr:hypothetical protein KR009_001671 [Drosophila setifemur]
MSFAHGISLGWFSPTIAFLSSDTRAFGHTVNIQEASWAGCLPGLGSLLSIITMGYPLAYFGRKVCMYWIAIPHAINWILIFISTTLVNLYLARFLVGVTGGALVVVFPIFTADISDNNVRGTLTSMIMLALCSGITVGFIMASYIPYFVMPCITVSLPVIYVIAIIALPETPPFLVGRGRDERAERSYYFYKNLSDTDNEAKAEFKAFQEGVLSGGRTEKITCRDFCNKPAMKAFGLIFLLIVTNQMSGSFALLNYGSIIFAQLGSQIDPNVCTILLGVTQFLGVLAAVFLVDRLGRRILLIPSLALMGCGEVTIGLLKSVVSDEVLQRNFWIGLVLVCFVAYMAAVGIVALTFVLVIELLPVKVGIGLSVALVQEGELIPQIRSCGASLSMMTLSVFSFTALKVYPLMIFNYGLGATMFMSSGFCLFTVIIFGFFLPETKNKHVN